MADWAHSPDAPQRFGVGGSQYDYCGMETRRSVSHRRRCILTAEVSLLMDVLRGFVAPTG
jgi:hypothetical protein